MAAPPAADPAGLLAPSRGRFVPQMLDGARRLLKRWDARSDGTVMNASAEMAALTLDVVGRVLFSADLTEDAADLGKALARGQRAVALAVLLPLNWSPRATRAVLAATRGFGGAREGIQEPVRRLVNQRASEAPRERDLLDLLIADRGDDGTGFSEAEIRDEVTTFMLAGHETTSNALGWTLALLSAYPPARERLEAELEDVLGDREPEADDLERLVWTQAVISEAMRLYPPAWTVERQALYLVSGPIPPGSTRDDSCRGRNTLGTRTFRSAAADEGVWARRSRSLRRQRCSP